jgi:hypothetical protein
MKRRGVIIFVVLGGIFVLTILILSYNHLVQGKFNENREILSHVRAMKAAQSISRFIVEKLKNDLKDVSSIEKDSPGNILRSAVFVENDPVKLSEKISNLWLEKINFTQLTQKLFKRASQGGGDSSAVKLSDVSVSSEITFSDFVFLKDLKKGNELFLDFEKAGKMKVTVEVNIGRTREEWSEERPFRVVVPYPLPLTKFSLYLRRATDDLDPVKFNTVTIDSATSGNVAPGSNQPLIIDNGLVGPNYNREEDIWKKRGWIHLGGGTLLLNRAAGNRNYGQRYHSYYDANMPIALILQFANFSSVSVGGKNLGFRMARWGFSNSLLNGPSSSMWKEILNWQMKERPPNKEKKWWHSTCLHLFGEVGKTAAERNLSITRISGKVYDRFIEIGYLIPTADGEAPIGAVIGHNKNNFDMISGKKKKTLKKVIQDIPDSITADTWVDTQIISCPVPVADRLGVDDLREMEDFFETLPYSLVGGGISYDKIMSRADFCSYDESYKMIAQYSKNSQNINIPPQANVPGVEEYDFKLSVMGVDTSALEIPKIAPENDSLLGMDKRVCYEIEAGESAISLLKKNFCNPDNRDFQLGNAVLRIVGGSSGLQLMDDLGAETGGMIMVDGPLTIGTFRGAASAENAPLAFMSEKGAITVKNNGSHPVLAYLIALDKNNGEIKCADPSSPLNLIGGIAAHSLDPQQIKAGGRLYYNQALDPTANSFSRYLGVVIGPAGGES